MTATFTLCTFLPDMDLSQGMRRIRIRNLCLEYINNFYSSIIKKLIIQSIHGQRSWIYNSLNEMYKWPKSKWKDTQTLLVIKEMLLIKLTMRYYLTSTRMAKTKKSDNKCWHRRCGETGTLIHCWWEHKMVQALCKIVWCFLRWLDLAIPLLGIYPKEMKACVHTEMCTEIFITTLFTIA